MTDSRHPMEPEEQNTSWVATASRWARSEIGVPTSLGLRMKKRRKQLLIAPSVALIAYIVWISWPHVGSVEITNHAGVTESDVEQIVQKLDSDHMFSGRRELATVASTFIDPRSRPRYFVEIEGTPDLVVVTAGYVRGELWGGGPIVGARKVDGVWIFDPYNALWKS